jgi:hypothetical protein
LSGATGCSSWGAWSTQVWDATVTNQTTERLMASHRCTQLILY